MNLGFHCQRLNHIQDRILAHGLDRGEFYNLDSQDMPALHVEVQAHRLAASIHCPLGHLDWYPDPPTWAFLCDGDPQRRQLNLRMVQDTLERAPALGAEYVVAHFPSPDSTGASPDSIGEWREIAWASAQALSEMSLRHGVPIHIEGFGPSPFLEPGFLSQVLRLPNLAYCFDTGHMSLAARRDGFDLFEFARALAPWVGSVHLWNTRSLDDYRRFRHIPLHPSQKPEAGWVDIPHLLPILRAHRPQAPLILESPHFYPPELGSLDMREGVQWVKRLLET